MMVLLLSRLFTMKNTLKTLLLSFVITLVVGCASDDVPTSKSTPTDIATLTEKAEQGDAQSKLNLETMYMSKNIPIPPSKMGKKLLVDDNFDYLMVIDEATISPITIKLGNNIKKEVIQAWVYVFYKTLYAPDVVDGEFIPIETNKHLVYFSLVDKTSASTVFYLYDKNGSLTNKMINDVKESDFKPVKQGTIGQIQFDIIKSSQKN